jgi:hypothetical protein
MVVKAVALATKLARNKTRGEPQGLPRESRNGFMMKIPQANGWSKCRPRGSEMRADNVAITLRF